MTLTANCSPTHSRSPTNTNTITTTTITANNDNDDITTTDDDNDNDTDTTTITTTNGATTTNNTDDDNHHHHDQRCDHGTSLPLQKGAQTRLYRPCLLIFSNSNLALELSSPRRTDDDEKKSLRLRLSF
jgi:hypothetical protein